VARFYSPESLERMSSPDYGLGDDSPPRLSVPIRAGPHSTPETTAVPLNSVSVLLLRHWLPQAIAKASRFLIEDAPVRARGRKYLRGRFRIYTLTDQIDSHGY
jgi:hypothetical protein